MSSDAFVLDAGALIALLDRDDAWHERVRDTLARHVLSTLHASVLNVAEALVHPAAAGRGGDAASAIVRLGVHLEPVAADAALPLGVLRARTRLRMPDVVALHTAKRLGAALLTTDTSLARTAEELGVGILALG